MHGASVSLTSSLHRITTLYSCPFHNVSASISPSYYVSILSVSSKYRKDINWEVHIVNCLGPLLVRIWTSCFLQIYFTCWRVRTLPNVGDRFSLLNWEAKRACFECGLPWLRAVCVATWRWPFGLPHKFCCVGLWKCESSVLFSESVCCDEGLWTLIRIKSV